MIDYGCPECTLRGQQCPACEAKEKIEGLRAELAQSREDVRIGLENLRSMQAALGTTEDSLNAARAIADVRARFTTRREAESGKLFATMARVIAGRDMVRAATIEECAALCRPLHTYPVLCPCPGCTTARRDAARIRALAGTRSTE